MNIKRKKKQIKILEFLAGPKIQLYFTTIYSSNIKYTESKHASQISNIKVNTFIHTITWDPYIKHAIRCMQIFLIKYMGFVWNALQCELVDETQNVVWLLFKIQVYLCVRSSDFSPFYFIANVGKTWLIHLRIRCSLVGRRIQCIWFNSNNYIEICSISM